MRVLSRLLFVFLILFVSCRGGKLVNKNQKEIIIEQQNQENNLESEGFVKAFVKDETGLDGCTFMLYLESDSTVLLPQNLDPKYAKDEIKIWLKYHPIKPMMSICMRGKPVYIEDLLIREQ